jgi:Novel toxin 16
MAKRFHMLALCVALLTASAGVAAAQGNCTPQRHAELQAAVTAACKVESRACDYTQDCATLEANYSKNIACAEAREAINDECFFGGDPGHQQAAQEARRAAHKCIALRFACEDCP